MYLQADYLLRQGLHLSDVIQGYELALDRIPAFLEETACHSVENLKDAKELEPGTLTVRCIYRRHRWWLIEIHFRASV